MDFLEVGNFIDIQCIQLRHDIAMYLNTIIEQEIDLLPKMSSFKV